MPFIVILAIIISSAVGLKTIESLDLNAEKAAVEIQKEIDKGDYEKANDLYVKKQDARVGSTAYENLKSVREQVEYYRRYRASIDLEKDPNPNKDWGFIINNLENAPPNFKYKKEVENLMTEAKSKINSPQQQAPTPAPVPTSTPSRTSIPDWTLIKQDDKITLAKIPQDSRMSTPDELFEAMNTFRVANGRPTLGRSDVLCRIASNRITKLEQLGTASHDGFEEEVTSRFNELASEGFSSLPTEVVFYGGPLLGVHIVEWGWNRSLTGHAEAIKDYSFNQGCGWTGRHSAVFIFGTK